MTRSIFAAVLLGAALFSSAQNPVTTTPAAPAPAQPQPFLPAPGTPTPTHSLAQPDLEAFFDGMFPLQLERSDIAGASVLVMKDGQVLLQKGYGYADLKTKRAVDPDTTIFRLASISKLFTWISVMQLQQQGKLDIDTDINRYLDFRIRPAFNKPITLRNLMTHTGGFEESLNNLIFTDPKNMLSLREDLIHNQPMRIFPPGEIPAYSNYGVGLASYIVQRISGEPFEQYAREHIFVPLGMKHSSFEQPLSKELAGYASEGYRSSTLKPPVGFEIVNPVGAGGLSSTASDMGRFGQALLNGGELDGNRILKPETLAEMWKPQYRVSDKMPAQCMGFYEVWRNGLHWIGHEGDLIAFHSLFFVEPQQKLILFVSYNSANGGGKPRPEVINAFSDRYFPGAPQVTFVNRPASELKAIEGAYQPTRRGETTKLRVSNIMGQTVATVDKDGVLTLSDFRDLRGHPVKWKPIDKDLWQAEDDQHRIFAIRDSRNRVVRIAFHFPGVQLQRVPWYENHGVVLIAVGTSLGILALVLLATLIRMGRRMFFRGRSPLAPQPGTIWLTFAPRTAAILWTLFLGSFIAFMAIKGDDLMPPTPDWFPWFVAINWVTGVCLLMSIFAVISAIRIWSKDLRRITKVKFSLVGLACVVLSWLAVFYHLIGPARRI